MKYFVVDEKSQKVFLLKDFNNEFKKMNSMEIFALFVRGTGPYKSYSIDNEIELLTFSKKPRDLAYKFHLETGSSSIIPVINDNVLTLDELLFVEDSGYIIRDLTWFPISRESLTEFKKIYSKSKGLKIETNLALKFMQERSLDFIEKENRNIVDVFNEQESNLTKEQSSLFVQKLYDYQERGVAWLKFCVANKIGTILGDDMGLGKTAQIIALISWLIENKITKKNSYSCSEYSFRKLEKRIRVFCTINNSMYPPWPFKNWYCQ